MEISVKNTSRCIDIPCRVFILATIFIVLLASFSTALAKDEGGLYIRQWISETQPEAEDFANRVLVLEFWATWCPPCVAQVPHLKKLASKYEDKDVLFLGLSQDNSAEKVTAFVKKNEINYFMALDGGTANRLGIDGIPAAFVIGHNGKVVWAGHPGSDEFEDAIKRAVAAAPASILAGIELGSYRHLRFALSGSKRFSMAYSKLAADSEKSDCPETAQAAAILAKINLRLNEKISAAQAIGETNPTKAIEAYKDIMDKFCCIKLTEQVPARIQELSKKTVAANIK